MRHIDLAVDKVGGQCGQPIVMALGPAVFDRQILPFDIAGFAQSPAERSEPQLDLCVHAGEKAAEETDHRHRLLLRVSGSGPPTDQPSEQG